VTITRYWMYGTVGQTYWGYVEVSGGVAPYSISIDVLPAGLALNPVPVNIFGGVFYEFIFRIVTVLTGVS